MREAARITRNQLLYTGSPEADRQCLASIARAYWAQDVRLANILISTSPVAQEHLSVSQPGCSHVNIVDFPKFTIAYNESFLTHHNSLRSELVSELANSVSVVHRKQVKSRLQCSQRMSQLFWPSSSRLKLAGISQQDNIVYSPEGIQQALINEWQPIHFAAPIDLEKAEKFLKTYVHQLGHLFRFSGLSELTREDFLQNIQVVRNGAPGPNGIPYAAYRACPELSATVFSKAYSDLSSQSPQSNLSVFNESLVWFAPKGVVEGEGSSVVRSPANLRTIFRSICDSKLICGTVSNNITSATLDVTPDLQRGFCRGRQLSLNVVDLDTVSYTHLRLPTTPYV